MHEESQEKEIFDLEQTLNLFRSLCTTIELPKLIQSILYTSMAQMRVTGAGLFSIGTLESGCFRLGSNVVNLEQDPAVKYMIPTKSPLVSTLAQLAHPIPLDELRCKIPVCKDLDTVESLAPTLIVPLIFRRRVNGILLLGERIESDGNGNPAYTDYEKKQIATLASLGAIAMPTCLRGTTDSELLFYYLLERQNAAIAQKGAPLNARERFLVTEALIVPMSRRNKLNLIVTDGELLYVHMNMRGTLHSLSLPEGTIFSTLPLTDDAWEAVPMTKLIAYENGVPVIEGQTHGNEYIPGIEQVKEHTDFVI